ncbi:MAG: DegT/DnrJ/EryC1/StrS family aminotransferase, partial [Chloroflexus sp.]|nr:DegT/DnrJ/EryC1/StrS family aminotransferase [Chloroflexus sp.]
LMAGATPVFVDIDPHTYNINPDLIAAAITSRTRAIMPVHLYGQPADMAPIMALAQRHHLVVIEDAAQAIGATYHGQPVGSFGIGCFSLYATKNVTSGEGGMITTNDPAIADRLRLLRNHGSRVRYYHELLGYNFRMTDLQAAIGRAQLAKCERFTNQRIANAAFLSEQIRHPAVITPFVQPDVRHVFHQYTIRVLGDRDAAIKQLNAAGVGTAIFYPLPIPQQPLYRKLGIEAETPVADRIAREIIALPVHPALSDGDLRQIAAAVNALTVNEPVTA